MFSKREGKTSYSFWVKKQKRSSTFSGKRKSLFTFENKHPPPPEKKPNTKMFQREDISFRVWWRWRLVFACLTFEPAELNTKQDMKTRIDWGPPGNIDKNTGGEKRQMYVNVRFQRRMQIQWAPLERSSITNLNSGSKEEHFFSQQESVMSLYYYTFACFLYHCTTLRNIWSTWMPYVQKSVFPCMLKGDWKLFFSSVQRRN